MKTLKHVDSRWEYTYKVNIISAVTHQIWEAPRGVVDKRYAL